MLLTLASVFAVVVWMASHSTRPTIDLYVSPQTAVGVGLEPGRLLLGRWHIDGDMDWQRLADAFAARPSYRLTPTDDGLNVEPNPLPEPNAAYQSRFRWDILVGELPVPAPHLGLDDYDWTTRRPDDGSVWTGRLDYAVLPLWALPWPLLAWPAWTALRRLQSSRRAAPDKLTSP